MELTGERIAQNQSTFRDANEQIEEAAQKYKLSERVPFICECADPTCSEILSLSLAEYETVRAGPRQFLVAAGHDKTAGDSVRVVAEHEMFTIAEKIGGVGEIAAQLDPRSDAHVPSTE